MIAELVFVGTELLLGEILNTNAQFLSQKLSALGIDCYYQTVVGDNADRLACVLRQALARADVVITSGGLGPTMDDLTRETTAAVCGLPLELQPGLLAGLEAFFARRTGRPMPENNRRQAMAPRGSQILHNDRGTAPGLIVPAPGGKAVVLLPGPPNELRPMFEQQVIPYLTGRMGGQPQVLVSRVLRFIDIGESALEDRLKDLIAAQSDPNIAPYAKLGEVHLRLSTKAASEAAGLAKIAPVEQAIRERVGGFIYGLDDTDLAAAVGHLLQERGLTVATAESCTGGLVAKRLTDASGSSAHFRAGIVAYSNEAKRTLLGVPGELLDRHGAVSEPVAEAMALGALARCQTDLAVAITGIAGPGGATPTKPVGMVCFGLAARRGAGPGGGQPDDVVTFTTTQQWWGSRDDVRQRSATFALALIRRFVLRGAI
jgi:nicotinamide-nucleotide amidase